MGWWIAAGAALTYMGQQERAKENNKLRGDAKKRYERSMRLQERRQEQWEKHFGPVAENLSAFYQSIMANDGASLVAEGLDTQKQIHDKNIQDIKTSAAQRGIDSPAMLQLEQEANLESARQEAELRNKAPIIAAEAGTKFMELGGNMTGGTEGGDYDDYKAPVAGGGSADYTGMGGGENGGGESDYDIGMRTAQEYEDAYDEDAYGGESGGDSGGWGGGADDGDKNSNEDKGRW